MLICHECEQELKEEYLQRLKKENRYKYNQRKHHSKIKRKLTENVNNTDLSRESFFSENNDYRPFNKRLTISIDKDQNKKSA